MRLILTFLLGCLLSTAALAATAPNEAQLRQQLQQAEANKGAADQAKIVEEYQAALNTLQDRKESLERATQYQRVIDDFPKLVQELRRQLNAEDGKPSSISDSLSSNDLEQQLLQTSSQLLEQARQLQQEQDRLREIGDSLSQLPQQQTEASRMQSDAERRIQSLGSPATPLGQAQLVALQAESALRKSRVDELELAQLSASNRQELSRLRVELYKKRHDRLDLLQQDLRSRLNNMRQREAEQALERTELLAEQSGDLPSVISKQLQVNRELSVALNQQAQRMDLIASQQRQAATHTIQVRQALSTIREQAQWLGVSPILGETLRAQIARLPEMPKPQLLDSDMAQLRVQRLHFEDLINKPQDLDKAKQDNGDPLTSAQQRILADQMRTQRDLLTSLISGCDSQILELTKLKVANNQLADALTETREAAHRDLFWVADVDPVTFAYPLKLVQDLTRLLSLDTLTQLGSALVMMVTSQETVLPLLGALLLVGFSISSRRHYHAFMERASSRVGKVTLDHFMLTLRTVFWSILTALPLPVLWAALGYGLQNAWPYPIAVAIGDSVTATVPLMWLVMISASFSHPQGLFIVHFRWSPERVARAMRYYRLSIAFIVPLIMALITFDKLNDREFSSTLGRLCFILLCMALSLVTTGLKRAGIPLYLDKEGSGENSVNRAMWNILIAMPLVAALASCIGYLATAQALLARLETSVSIWFFLLVVYHIIRRWMLIQRRRIAFDRAKQRRSEILAQRAKGEEDSPSASSHESSSEAVEEPVVDLDAISAKSLQLVRSILTLIALVSVIALWSEIHSAFAFLENISLWDVSSTVKGVESVQAITLGSVLIAILIFIITAQLVRNLPALLELAILQHLDLSPGSGYAITTISKYILMLIGCMMGFSLIGIEWSKLQWLVAALGLGLGFGMQEIFANFISGLIILFEKPMRIGDTVTIRDLTGSVMRINTRATTISDWDRKEIIVPNKAFITEQFINWSLSDSVTRVVMTVPAPANANSQEVTELLMDAVKRCSLILDTPEPEVFLVDLQQGLQIFELRIFAAEMGHRMPLRHELHQLILENYRKHNLELPFPPFQVKMDNLSRSGKTLTPRQRTPGSL
ncbi:miniconductance mechanosensitive channel MscM [Pectobacterium brasiliense]|uniref:miniconductance mechanosensitive channel MscM n=1 Tax=Pectobacterium TaxID=122277 RepID=UPI00069CAB61|nr:MULTISPECIES: miniconductance mechanosensitive channel MscM [Pectobacterium]MCA5921644.1 miniconductance mechanosensitive channel MscM [Pectobacterium brasiliense]MCA5928745.1 miniconductance mechanosensitive channel MscM [Pectobacterium brasiliense]MCA5937636.1 miniconductance mechanosensitive channel MscM [Pectobacterium brasiliense]MCA5941897.1 miniconductance mechanosensitive channel MscM [Pectobacterium brasiliense]MCA5945873.1 miniconductance mechanosensitive channel MscM [Pectobacter